jgi:hypothetical protein
MSVTNPPKPTPTPDNDWLNLALARFEEQIIADDGEPLRVGELSYREQTAATITQHIREAEVRAELKGKIAGLKASHRYRGNPFMVGEKVIKEIERLTESLHQLGETNE